MRLEEITRKLASNSPITFVTYKRFAVMLHKLINDWCITNHTYWWWVSI